MDNEPTISTDSLKWMVNLVTARIADIHSQIKSINAQIAASQDTTITNALYFHRRHLATEELNLGIVQDEINRDLHARGIGGA